MHAQPSSETERETHPISLCSPPSVSLNNNKRQENAAASSDASAFKRTWDHVKSAAAGMVDAKGAAGAAGVISPARKRNPLAAATAGPNGVAVASHAAAFAVGSTPGAGGFMGPPPPRPKGDESVKVREKRSRRRFRRLDSFRGERGNERGKKTVEKKGKNPLLTLSVSFTPKL